MEHESKDIKRNLILLDMIGNKSIDTYQDMLKTIDNIIDPSLVRIACEIRDDMSDKDLKLLIIFSIITFEENSNIFIFPYKYTECVYQHHHYLHFNPVNRILSVKYGGTKLPSSGYEIIYTPRYYIRVKNVNKNYIPTKCDEKMKLEITYTIGYYNGKKDSVPQPIINAILEIVSDIYHQGEWKEVLSIEQYKVTA